MWTVRLEPAVWTQLAAAALAGVEVVEVDDELVVEDVPEEPDEEVELLDVSLAAGVDDVEVERESLR
ncbi:hypothetical protein [Georgenia subflava]|uniref:hypothetical protein n=1 Tax=Georgenia subflava TaxID=1622177 RepID=UPI0029CA6F15|nr:hypothetical protein [Georgenia subflava]